MPGLCYGKPECALLFFLTPSLLLGHMSGLLPDPAKQGALAAFVLLATLFALRKYTQPVQVCRVPGKQSWAAAWWLTCAECAGRHRRQECLPVSGAQRRGAGGADAAGQGPAAEWRPAREALAGGAGGVDQLVISSPRQTCTEYC